MSQPVVAQISIYPIKSTAGINLSHSWIDALGPAFDRRFVVADHQGQFITARSEPKLCLIRSHLTAQGLMLTAPDMPPLSIDYDQFSRHYQPVQVWKDQINAQYCNIQYDQWISSYLNRPCQLVYFGEQSARQVNNSDNQVAFADGYPLLLISRSALDELNQRCPVPVDMRQFRPNIVLDHCPAFAEDGWQRIRIGTVEFELSKPCSRCVFTTVNPDNGHKHPGLEPLTTLKQYRQADSGDVMFGQNLIPLNAGSIALGDEVQILAKRAPAVYVDKAPPQRSNVANSTAKAVEQLPSFPLQCVNIIDETHDVKTFMFKHPQNKHLPYIAGQHLPFTLMLNGEAAHCCYTLSSSPTRPEHLAITVKRVAGGRVSNALHDNFQVGDFIEAKTPVGSFHLNSVSCDKMLLLSAGSGVTPMLAMLKAMTDLTLHNDVVFLHSAHSSDDIIAREEVAALAKQHGNCRVHYTLTRQAKPDWQDYQGRLSAEMLARIPALTERQVFVCGPQGFRDAAQALLSALGLPATQFHQESFGRRNELTTSPAPETEAKPQQLTINFSSWHKVYRGDNQQTLLEQGEAAGLILPYSCRGGMCGSCKVKLDQGEVTQLADDGLTDEEKQQGYILACSCIPRSDVSISRG